MGIGRSFLASTSQARVLLRGREMKAWSTIHKFSTMMTPTYEPFHGRAYSFSNTDAPGFGRRTAYNEEPTAQSFQYRLAMEHGHGTSDTEKLGDFIAAQETSNHGDWKHDDSAARKNGNSNYMENGDSAAMKHGDSADMKYGD